MLVNILLLIHTTNMSVPEASHFENARIKGTNFYKQENFRAALRAYARPLILDKETLEDEEKDKEVESPIPDDTHPKIARATILSNLSATAMELGRYTDAHELAEKTRAILSGIEKELKNDDMKEKCKTLKDKATARKVRAKELEDKRVAFLTISDKDKITANNTTITTTGLLPNAHHILHPPEITGPALLPRPLRQTAARTPATRGCLGNREFFTGGLPVVTKSNKILNDKRNDEGKDEENLASVFSAGFGDGRVLLQTLAGIDNCGFEREEKSSDDNSSSTTTTKTYISKLHFHLHELNTDAAARVLFLLHALSTLDVNAEDILSEACGKDVIGKNKSPFDLNALDLDAIDDDSDDEWGKSEDEEEKEEKSKSNDKEEKLNDDEKIADSQPHTFSKTAIMLQTIQYFLLGVLVPPGAHWHFIEILKNLVEETEAKHDSKEDVKDAFLITLERNLNIKKLEISDALFSQIRAKWQSWIEFSQNETKDKNSNTEKIKINDASTAELIFEKQTKTDKLKSDFKRINTFEPKWKAFGDKSKIGTVHDQMEQDVL